MRVLVVGFGITGRAVARHARASGHDLVVVDDAAADLPGAPDPEADLEVPVRPVPRGDEIEAVLDTVDLVVPSPGVPSGHPLFARARARGLPVRAEIDLAAELATERGTLLAAVTGTNGKTTVTDLAATMLRAGGRDAVAAGNIGTPLLDVVGRAEVVVAEVSSFQLSATTAAFRPDVAALLNVAPDHLDWHGTFESYARAKAKVFAHQRPDALLVHNADDAVVTRLAEEAPGRTVAFSVASDTEHGYRVVGSPDERLLVGPDGEPIVAVSELGRRAPHDLANVLAAAAVAMACGARRDAVARAARSFEPAPHRLRDVGEHAGVRFVDDSKATNVHAASAGIRSFERVVLIAGGRNKGLDLGPLRQEAERLVAVVAIGDATEELVEVFTGCVPVIRASSMDEAVRAAAIRARPGDVVLLSPACASFDWYGSYGERGDAFARAVHALGEEPARPGLAP